jgi:erythromycin esterase-like protein
MAKKLLWELKKNKVIYMPLTMVRLERWISEGKVKANDLVWRSGFAVWKKAGEIKELKPFFRKRGKKED